MKKITDDDIQDYLDDNLNPLHREYIEAAMQSNPVLAERIEEYRLMRNALKRENTPLDSREFVDAVMARVEKVSLDPSAPRWRALDWLPLSAASALILGLIYLFGFNQIVGLLRSIPIPDFSWVTSAVAEVEQAIQSYERLLPYVGFSAGAALLYSLLDRIFIASRYERIHS